MIRPRRTNKPPVHRLPGEQLDLILAGPQTFHIQVPVPPDLLHVGRIKASEPLQAWTREFAMSRDPRTGKTKPGIRFTLKYPFTQAPDFPHGEVLLRKPGVRSGGILCKVLRFTLHRYKGVGVKGPCPWRWKVYLEKVAVFSQKGT